MPDVFFNFSGADRTLAGEIASAFEHAGLVSNTGYDDDFVPGLDYASMVLGALEEARCIVTLWTPRSVNSNWVIAESKVGFAKGTLLPVAIGITPADIPPPFNLVQAFVTRGDTLSPDELDQLIKLAQHQLALKRPPSPLQSKGASFDVLSRPQQRLEQAQSITPRNKQARKKAFVSYATEDETIANELVRHLEKRDCPCWVSFRDVDPGQDYRQAITSVMPQVSFLVLLHSTHANKSFDIGNELLLARRRDKERLVVKIDDAEPSGPVEYEIVSIQAVDGRKDRTGAFEKIAQRARLL